MRDSLKKEIELWKEIPPLAQQKVLLDLIEQSNKKNNNPAQYNPNITVLETDLGLKTKQCELDEHLTDVCIAYEAAYKILVLITAGETI